LIKAIFTAQYRQFKTLLKGIREERNVTQVELAARLKMTQGTISKIEMGEQRIDVIQLRAWCKAVGTTLPRFTARLERMLEGKLSK